MMLKKSSAPLYKVLFLVTLLVALVISGLPLQHPKAATAISVSQAISSQNNSIQTVEGYVVGQPTGTTTVVTSNYPNDYALAIADTPTETNPSKMLYVQISSTFRSGFGLQTNPTLKGKQIAATGNLTAYFSHPGLKNVTMMSKETSGTTDQLNQQIHPLHLLKSIIHLLKEKRGLN